MQTQESKVVSSKAVDVDLVVMESNGTESEKQDTSSSSWNYLTHVVDADIRPIDNNTTPDSTNMSHGGGEIDQDAKQYQVKSPLLNVKLFKTKDMDSLEFREFFEINKLKAQLQDKNSTINNLKKQIKNVHEKSNEAKVKHDIDVMETINIELGSSVAKLLVENEKLNKENEHLKQSYKELYDSIKKKRIQTKDHNDSLIAQVNSKTVENADLKAQIQEQVFANVALKNELRKLKGNSENTKFAKSSILGKPVLQPLRNQSVVRQPTAFRSEQPKFSKPRNSSNESYGLNDMAHKYYLEVAKKKTQDKNMNLKPSVMHTTRLQNTANGSKPKSRSNNQTSKSLPVPKINHGMLNGVTLVDHSKNSSSFSDSKHFVCLTCQKCVFNANHDDCITKFLKEVNSRAKVQFPMSRNNIKPAKRIPNVNKPERRISKGYRFSPNKSSAVYEKPNTPRSCLRWKPTGRIFKFAGLKWIPTGKMFTNSTTKVDSEPLNGSNDDITNPYECDQTLNISACTLNLSARPGPQLMTPGTINSGLVQNIPSSTPAVPPTKIDWDLLFQPRFDEYFKPPSNVDHPVPTASTSSPSSTTVDQDAPSTSTSQTTSKQQSSVIPQGVEVDFYDIEVAHMDNDPYFGIPIPEPSSEKTTLQWVIPSNLHHLNQSFDTLTKLRKKHPLENV
ncbi:hypothetical protein Tco_1074310, partial [Tanacetum coccineum]